MANGIAGNDTPGSVLVLSGLRKIWLWSAVISVGGSIVWFAMSQAGDPGVATFVWFVVGLTATVTAIVGLVEIYRGAAILLPLLERSSHASLTHEPGSRERTVGSASAPNVLATAPAKLDDAELAAKEAAEREIAREERRKRFDGVDPLVALLSDPEVAAKARDLQRVYGRSVSASFLTTTASELGMGDVEFKPEDIPDDL